LDTSTQAEKRHDEPAQPSEAPDRRAPIGSCGLKRARPVRGAWTGRSEPGVWGGDPGTHFEFLGILLVRECDRLAGFFFSRVAAIGMILLERHRYHRSAEVASLHPPPAAV
jgi:hypothetical protein